MDAPILAGWENFYVIVGTSAGGLTGLTFVVIVLVRETMHGARPAGVGAFVTPTIVHFGGVLALAAFLSMTSTSVMGVILWRWPVRRPCTGLRCCHWPCCSSVFATPGISPCG
jgi:hypothetical protein